MRIEKIIQDLIFKYKESFTYTQSLTIEEPDDKDKNELYMSLLEKIIFDLNKLQDELKTNELLEENQLKENTKIIENYTNKMINDLNHNYLVVKPVKNSNYYDFVLNGNLLNKVTSFDIRGRHDEMTLFNVEMWIDSFKLKRLEE